MYDWQYDTGGRDRHWLHKTAIVVVSGLLTVTLYVAFHDQIERINQESTLMLNLMFLPAMLVGLLYGIKVAEKAMRPAETRSPRKRSIIKIFLFFFVIGSLFSSVNFAMSGGSSVPITMVLEMGVVDWTIAYVTANGGATFLIITSIALMAAATRRLVQLGGALNMVFTFVGTSAFLFMLALTFTQSNPTQYEVFLFTFYQAGIIGGVLYEMNKLTRHANYWEDYQNGY